MMQPTITGYLALLIAAKASSPDAVSHAVNVSELVVTFGRFLKLDGKLLDSIRIGGLLHDIGKLTVPDEILDKPEALDAGELAIIHRHPLKGHEMVSPLELNAIERYIILFHHERWDGAGYPYGFAGEDIPLAARLVGLADAFDAMLSARPYRQRLGLRAVITEIRDQAGAQFDPELAAKLEKTLLKIGKQYKS